ncbi:MAG: hypothetical protein ACOC31_01020 [Bacteroidota bacterium]
MIKHKTHTRRIIGAAGRSPRKGKSIQPSSNAHGQLHTTSSDALKELPENKNTKLLNIKMK